MYSASEPRLDDAIPGSEVDLAADVLHLRQLRLLEARLRGGEVGAGVDHLLVEPQAIEVVADVVVVVDVVASAAAGVGPVPPATPPRSE
jgi:hypothetical protein